jgi:hypothetical protein
MPPQIDPLGGGDYSLFDPYSDINRLRYQNILGSYGTYGQPSGMHTGMIPPDMAPQPNQLDPTQVSPGQLSQIANMQADTSDSPTPDDFNAYEWMRQNYHPETAASERLNQMLASYPQRDAPDTRPSIGRRIVSSMMAASPHANMEQISKVMEQPYTDKLTDWATQVNPTLRAAELERQANTNERQMLYQSGTLERYRRQQTETERKNKELESAREERNAINRFKAEHPSAKIVAPPGGFIMATGFDPENPSASRYILGPDGKKISSGKMTQEALAQLNQENKLEQIAATGAEARKTEGVKQTGKLEIKSNTPIGQVLVDGKPYAVYQDTKTGEPKLVPVGGMPSGGGTVTKVPSGNATVAKPTTPADTARSAKNRAGELKNDPIVGSYIRLGTGPNDITLTQYSSWKPGGPSKQQYDAVYNYIYKGGPKPMFDDKGNISYPPQQGGGGGTKGQPIYQKSPSTGRVRMSNDGGKTWQEVQVKQ